MACIFCCFQRRKKVRKLIKFPGTVDEILFGKTFRRARSWRRNSSEIERRKCGSNRIQ